MKSSALTRLLGRLSRPPHDYRASLQTFPDLDSRRIAEELELERLGSERGAKEEPASASTGLDEVERRIVERVEAEKKRAHAIVEDEMRTYAERLASLDFEGCFGSLRQTVPACIGEFRAEVAKGLDELHGSRRDLREAEAELDAFKRRHRLERAAITPSPAKTALKIAVLCAVFLIEAVLNGSFLAKGSEQGLLGGFTEAVSFAFLNVGVAFLLGRFGAVQLVHRALWRKAIGLLALAAYVCFTLVLNLALAHYREIAATFVDGGGALAIRRLVETPFGLEEIGSWVFAGIGILFSLIAFIDALLLADPYPGYGHVKTRLEERRESYLQRRADLIDDLADVRDSFREEFEEISRNLSSRRAEHDTILSSRTRLLQAFEQHQSGIERVGSALLATYREANVRARKTPPPARFGEPFTMERIGVAADLHGTWNAEDLRRLVSEMQALVTSEVQAIHREFEAAIERYRKIDDLVDEEAGHVPAAA